jgi:hypothetical protein
VRNLEGGKSHGGYRLGILAKPQTPLATQSGRYQTLKGTEGYEGSALNFKRGAALERAFDWPFGAESSKGKIPKTDLG